MFRLRLRRENYTKLNGFGTLRDGKMIPKVKD